MGKAIEDMSFQIQVLENRIAELESQGSGDVSEVAYTTGHLNRIEDRLDAIEGKLKPVDTGLNKIATQEDIATVLEHNLELDERLKIVEDTLHSPSARSTDTTEPHRAAEPSKRTRNNARAFTDAYEPVEGAILIKDFAELHGVNQNTFRDHVRKGIGPEKEKAPAYSRDKPGRPGEKEYWILPEQQQQVIDFWRRFGVRFTVPAGDDLSQSEQDQEESKL